MKRRPLVALVSLCVLAVLGIAVLVVGVAVVRSERGHEQLRRFVQAQVAGSVNGRIHIGRIRGGPFTDLSIDSLEIRGPDDSLFVATGRITLSYDPRDLADRRILLRDLRVERPRVHLRQFDNGDWNYRHVFRGSGRKGPRQSRGFGDFVVANALRATGGTFVLSLPWHPADSLRGAKLDSAIRFALGRRDAEIRRVLDSTRSKGHAHGDRAFTRTYRWTNAYAVVSHARVADPDSAGKFFRLDTLHFDEFDPPFRFRNIAGTVRQLGDSVWLDVPHFDLPGSTGRATGKVVWGSGLPNRYDIRVIGDSVSLRDVAWVYPTLPREGSGRMRLHIRNDPRNVRVIDYALSDMDVRSTRSRLLGNMTFGVGGPVLVVKDVRLRADPVDFELVRVLNGKPFPVDWQGTLTGTVVARGGPVNRWVVDAGDITFRDRHVPGAVTHATGRGMLDILFPAFTAFRDFHVETDRLDLRSIEYLFPNFPRLGGIAAGVATLDSSWLDVRFRDADVTHRNGPGEPSRLTGSGRVTWGEQFMTYDVALQAQPLSLPMFARAYPTLPVHGLVSGPIRARGTAENLDLTATLTGDAGTLYFDGNVDSYPPGLRARGRGGFAALDLRGLVAREATPPTTLTGSYEVDLTLDSLANAAGQLAVRLERSMVDGVRIAPSRASLRFADGRLLVDTAELHTAAGVLRAAGALGLRPGVRDSILARVEVDSLGGLRRYLASRPRATLANTPADSSMLSAVLAAADSLGGDVWADVVLSGSLDSLEAHGRVGGNALRLRANGVGRARGEFALRDLLRGGSGDLSLRFDTISVLGLHLDSVVARVTMLDARRARFSAQAAGTGGGTTGSIAGSFTRTGDTLSAVIDSLDVALEDEPWRLVSPVRITSAPDRLQLDTLSLAHHGVRHLWLWAQGEGSALRAVLQADSVPLAHLGELAELRSPLGGVGRLRWTMEGTRRAPVMHAEVDLDAVRFGGMELEAVRGRADYRDRRADASVVLARKGTQVLSATASLPLSLVPGEPLLRGDSLGGRVRADAADFSIVEAFSPTLRNARGRFDADLALGGTWSRPMLGGHMSVSGGEVEVQSAGIRLVRIGADVVVTPSDSAGMRVQLRRLFAQSGGAADTLSLTGWVQAGHLRDALDPSFDLRLALRNFHAIDRRSLARLDLSTGFGGLHLSGRMRDARLAGTVRVDRGTIFIPDVRGKEVLSADELEAFTAEQSGEHTHIVAAPSRLIERLSLDGVRVEIGDEVWLRSSEANVKLGGSLSVTRALEDAAHGPVLGVGTDSSGKYRLALEGVLRADRGTYTLDLAAVRREFQVERGTISWLGTPDIENPVVDISALYRVKQADRPDIGIRARLTGPVRPAPMLQLESAENYALSQSDLVSYLVTGRPSFDQARDADQVQTAADVLLPSLSTTVGQYLRSQFGSLLDAVQIQAGATSLGAGGDRFVLQQGALDFLGSTRLGGEKQIRDNLFFSFSTGFCSLNKDAQGAEATTFVEGLGGKLEYRFPSLSLQVGREPPASALSCGRLGRGVIPTPSQWGVSLSRSWRF